MNPEEIIKLAKKIAFSVHQKIPTVEYEELYGEATLKIYQIMDKWDPSRGAFSTFIWTGVCNALYDFARKEIRYKTMEGLPDRYVTCHADLDLNEVQKLKLAGYTHVEIAEQLNISLAEVRKNVRINIRPTR